MASEYGTCPICMEDFDLENRMPKSLECRHSLCKLCLMNKRHPLSSCPICRQPVRKHENVPHDLTMIDYVNHKRRKVYLKEQEKIRKRLSDLTERTRVELRHIGELQEEHKQILEGRENQFRQHIMSVFKTCLDKCSLMNALNRGGLMSVTVCRYIGLTIIFILL